MATVVAKSRAASAADIVWARAGGVNFAPTHYCPAHEWIIVFARNRIRLKNRAALAWVTCWYVPQDGDNPHPAPFPLGLPGRAIESTAPQSVLDPMMGSGTPLRAAKTPVCVRTGSTTASATAKWQPNGSPKSRCSPESLLTRTRDERAPNRLTDLIGVRVRIGDEWITVHRDDVVLVFGDFPQPREPARAASDEGRR